MGKADHFLHKVKKYPGIYYYVSSRRRWEGRPERCFYIRYKDSMGRRVREKVGWESEGITAAYAAQIRAERLRTIRLGDEPVPIQKKRKLRTTFEDFTESQYLPWARENKKTYKRDEQLYRIWLRPTIGGKALKEISPLDLERIKKVMKDAGRSPRTIQYALAVVRQILNKAKQWGFYEGEPPTRQVKPPRVDNRRMRFLTPEEARMLLEACRKRSQQLYEICLLSLHCGLRAGEIFRLCWGDIDLRNGLIFIKDPKSGVNRVAYMTKEVKRMFKSKTVGEPDELVFKSRKGGPITLLSRTFMRVVDELGFNRGITDPRDKVVFHTLRHTFASWLASQGTPIHMIAELLGHRTLVMAKRYSHLIPSAKQEAVRKVEDIFNKSKREAEGSELES